MFGLGNYILPEPFSLINSIILSIGIHGFGYFIVKYFFKDTLKNSFLNKSIIYFSYIFGYNVLITTFLPLADASFTFFKSEG